MDVENFHIAPNATEIEGLIDTLNEFLIAPDRGMPLSASGAVDLSVPEAGLPEDVPTIQALVCALEGHLVQVKQSKASNEEMNAAGCFGPPGCGCGCGFCGCGCGCIRPPRRKPAWPPVNWPTNLPPLPPCRPPAPPWAVPPCPYD